MVSLTPNLEVQFPWYCDASGKTGTHTRLFALPDTRPGVSVHRQPVSRSPSISTPPARAKLGLSRPHARRHCLQPWRLFALRFSPPLLLSSTVMEKTQNRPQQTSTLHCTFPTERRKSCPENAEPSKKKRKSCKFIQS